MNIKEVYEKMNVVNNYKGYDLKIFCDLVTFHSVDTELNKQELEYILNNYDVEFYLECREKKYFIRYVNIE